MGAAAAEHVERGREAEGRASGAGIRRGRHGRGQPGSDTVPAEGEKGTCMGLHNWISQSQQELGARLRRARHELSSLPLKQGQGFNPTVNESLWAMATEELRRNSTA